MVQSDPKNHQLRITAYHEAGHAVVAFLLGRWITRVTIVPGYLYDSDYGDRGYLGLMESTDGHSYEDALMLMAGPAAEKQFGHPQPLGWVRDYVMVENSLKKFKAKKGFKSVKQYAEKLVELMVKQHWGLITALAERLLVVKEMDWDDAREFLIKAHEKLIRDAHYPPEPIFEGLDAYAKWMEEHKDQLDDLEEARKWSEEQMGAEGTTKQKVRARRKVMAYRPEQLPFIGFEKMVKEEKKAFDKRGGHYPLQIVLRRGCAVSEGDELLTVEFKNVWDRKPKIWKTPEEWDVPINFEVWENHEWVGGECLDKVQVRTDFAVQKDFGEILADEKA